jgi:hypothetical protein
MSDIFSRDLHSKLSSPRFCVHIPDFHTILAYRRDVGLWKRRKFWYDISIYYRYIFASTCKYPVRVGDASLYISSLVAPRACMIANLQSIRQTPPLTHTTLHPPEGSDTRNSPPPPWASTATPVQAPPAPAQTLAPPPLDVLFLLAPIAATATTATIATTTPLVDCSMQVLP